MEEEKMSSSGHSGPCVHLACSPSGSFKDACQRLGQLRRTIARSAVGDDEVHVPIGDVEHTLDRLGDALSLVECGNDDGEQGHGTYGMSREGIYPTGAQNASFMQKTEPPAFRNSLVSMLFTVNPAASTARCETGHSVGMSTWVPSGQ